jgi:hypothetical protein
MKNRPTILSVPGRFIACGALGALALAGAASANSAVYDCAVNAQTSTFVQSTDIAAPFAGTFKGNYDATTTPTGTQTRLGYFGGSGNQLVNYTASFALNGDINSHPTGTLVADLDEEALQVRISNLNFDLLGATAATLPATVNINYQTFHTVSPNGIFPGGVTIPVPVGNANVTKLRAVQSGKPTIGVLVPRKTGGYTFTAAVPVDLILSADALGTPIADNSVIPGVLPVTGTLTATPAGLQFSFTISGTNTQTQPITNGTFTDQPLALPTVIPAGGTANLLISGAVTSVTVATTINSTTNGAGTRRPVTGDLNGDYAVNASDMAILLGNWAGTGVGDLNGDGSVGPNDLSILLNNWG